MPTTTENKIEAVTKLLRAGWHPIQIQSLHILTERTASPKGIAEALGLPKTKAGYISHHVRELEKRGMVVLERTEPRRGANEHFFRAVQPLVVSDGDARRMSFEERLLFSCWIVACMSHDFARSVEAGTIDERVDRHLTRSPLLLDEQGYQEMFEEHERVFERSQEIQAEAEARMAATGEEPQPVSSLLCFFPTPNGVQSLDQ